MGNYVRLSDLIHNIHPDPRNQRFYVREKDRLGESDCWYFTPEQWGKILLLAAIDDSIYLNIDSATFRSDKYPYDITISKDGHMYSEIVTRCERLVDISELL